MKLYTEEQVRKAIHIKSNNIDLLTSDDIIGSLTPIELPSDEEVEIIFSPDEKINNNYYIEYTKGCNYGAKWVIEQIKNQVIP